MGVDPDVNVTSGCLHLACDLRVVQRHLGQDPFLAAPVLWHPVVSCGVDVHGPVSSDLWVDHHLIGVANATRARQLGQKTTKDTHLFHICISFKHI